MATTRVTARGETPPADDEFLQQLQTGGELLAAGKVIEAKDYLERAHRLQPRHEKGQNLLGLTYFKLGLFDRAAELYEMLVRDNPVDPTLRVNLGLVYLKTNALQRAVREFETATELAPDHQKAHNYLGLALAQQGEYGRAREHFLLAGSDAMAEKMSRAIAGESFSRPAAEPPARTRGFTELDGTDAVREQGGEGAAPARAAPRELILDVESEPPASRPASVPPIPTAPLPRQALPPAEDDWRAQYGLDDAPPRRGAPAARPAPAGQTAPAAPPVAAAPPAAAAQPAPAAKTAPAARTAPAAQPAPAAPPAPDAQPVALMEEEPRHAEDEGPSALSDGVPLLTAMPEEAEAAPVLEAAPVVEATPGAEAAPVLEATPEAEAAPVLEATSEVEAAPVLEAAPEPPAPVAEAREEERAEAPPAEEPALALAARVPAQAVSVEEPPAPEAEPRAPAAPPSAESYRGAVWRHDSLVPLLRELAPSVALAGASPTNPFVVGSGSFSVQVDGELLTRLEGLVAFSGKLAFRPELKRFRGRATDKPFGEGAGRMVRASGRGVLYLEPPERRTFLAVDLGDESAYFRDECVFAFEEPVMYENGRVPSDVAPDLDLVHLRGQGKVLLSLPGALRSVPVGEGAAVSVPLTHLVGWRGGITPRVVPLLTDPQGKALRVVVELSGEGFALISLPVR